MITTTVRFKPGDIARAMAEIKGIVKMTHRFTASDIAKDFSTAFKRTKRTTMVATGETRKSMFAKINQPQANGSFFAFGYGPTKNNQSIEQELGGGKVHRTEKSHYNEHGYAKCSRTPNDIYSAYGSYTSNPRAIRGAMRKAIKNVFKTSGDIIIYDRGDTYYYTSSFKRYVDIKSTRIANIYKAIGIS